MDPHAICGHALNPSNTNAMPYRSKAQQRWAHTPAGTKALGGKEAVKEWDRETKGKKLPARTRKKK
jgi:hypothetical protein